MVGQDRAGSQAEVASILHAEMYANAHRDAKKFPDPFVVPKPWTPPDPNADVTPERRLELVTQLNERSAFPGT